MGFLEATSMNPNLVNKNKSRKHFHQMGFHKTEEMHINREKAKENTKDSKNIILVNAFVFTSSFGEVSPFSFSIGFNVSREYLIFKGSPCSSIETFLGATWTPPHLSPPSLIFSLPLSPFSFFLVLEIHSPFYIIFIGNLVKMS